jgi:hypothetical protein
MAKLLLEGKGRISRATFYKDSSLGRARADDESVVRAYVHPTDAHRLMGRGEEGHRRFSVDLQVPYHGSVPMDLVATTDFYVYCLAESCDLRLFDDFKADTCVLIKEPETFKKRLEEAIAGLLPDWKYLAGPVIYFDPFFARPHQMAPQFFKHFRYSYQKEHRLCWLPLSSHRAPDHVYFDVGPLTDCAELIWL